MDMTAMIPRCNFVNKYQIPVTIVPVKDFKVYKTTSRINTPVKITQQSGLS